jgi:tetratricopeptide (TPR) repeat protein
VTKATATTARASIRVGAVDPHAVGLWALGGIPVTYLGVRGGGYDPLVHTEVAIGVWWIVLVGAAVGALPATRPSRMGWAALSLFALLAVWTAASIGWSDSPDTAIAESARSVLYVGVFALAVTSLRAGHSTRHLLSGVAAGIVAVAVVAVVARLYPGSFPQTDERLASGRLAYPLNYWNGLAALCAIGIPLLFGLTRAARSLAGQSIAAAGIPLLVLVLYLTASRAGAIAMAIALLVLVVATDDRLTMLTTAAATACGSALLVGVTERLDALQADAQGPRAKVIVALVLICGGAALIQYGVSLVARHVERPGWSRPSPRRTAGLSAMLATFALAISIAAGLPGYLGDRWEEFKGAQAPSALSSPSGENLFERLRSANGLGRYEMWQVAWSDLESKPITGRGAGSFELSWASERSADSLYARNAHSLYLETLGNLGVVGFALLVGLLVLMLFAGITGLVRRQVADRPLTAAAMASLVAFCAAAAVDWEWQIPAVSLAGLAAGASLLGPRRRSAETPASSRSVRAVLCVIAIASIALCSISLTGTSSLRSSRADARDGRLVSAATAARRASDAQPFAAAPQLQLALVLERAGAYDLAVERARKAVTAEPRNWEGWLVAARIEAKRGNTQAAIRDYRRARTLNPHSPVFNAIR